MDKKIQSVKITRFDYLIRRIDDEELDLSGHLHNFTEYDHHGNTLKEIRYNHTGEFEEMNEYSYNGSGELASERYYPEPDMIAEEVTYFRDDSGRVSHTEKHYQDGSVDTTRYAYDDAGQLTGKTTTSDEGETEQIETFIWDQGKVVAHEVTDGAGNPAETEYPGRIDQHEIKVTRNEHDQVVSEEELDENGETLMTVHRSYNPDGTAHEVEVFQDGRGRTISRHYFLRYEYTFFE